MFSIAPDLQLTYSCKNARLSAEMGLHVEDYHTFFWLFSPDLLFNFTQVFFEGGRIGGKARVSLLLPWIFPCYFMNII